MARHNLVFLLGFVTTIHIIRPEGADPYALCYITVARGPRSVGDHKKHMKMDNPVLMCRDPQILREMEGWQTNDIVEVKGMIAAKNIRKASHCAFCGEKNAADGVIVYVNPIFAKKRMHFDTQDECLAYLGENQEVSNQAFIFGTLCRDPKKIRPKEGLIVTQYQIALNRKFRIQADAPEIRTDYPWVKSYGENAVRDREYLHVGSQVFIDGCIQARKVNRHTVCAACGQRYDWADKALEIVPFETEYIANFYTEEEVKQAREKIAAEQVRNVLMGLKGIDPDTLPDDEYTEDDIRAGIESEE